MKVCEKVYTKVFEGKSKKEAYLNCCKWLSSNVIALNNSKNIVYDIKKSEKMFDNRVTLTLYISAEEPEIFEQTCRVCEETSGLFYMSQQKHKCESCKINPYRMRMQGKLKLLKDGTEWRK